MELSWKMKLRIAAVAALGVVLVGIVAWPSGRLPDPFATSFINSLGTSEVVTLLVMAFLAGLIAYFIAWPYGREIGILAVPFGLTVWAVRAGNVAALMQLNLSFSQRQTVLSTLKWEPFFWLIVVISGFAGVILGQKIRPSFEQHDSREKSGAKAGAFLNPLIALAASVLIAQFCIKILAQDVILSDNRLGSVVAQPAVGQIVFAVFVSFGLAAFLVKKFLNVNYIWPAFASSLVTAFTAITYMRAGSLQYVVQAWPAAFFSHAVITILPLQMVTFGTIGSIAGYWMAVRYRYWRKHEMTQSEKAAS